MMMEVTQTDLYQKIYSSLAASAIGDAMGGPVEGLDWWEIDAQFGIVDEFLPYSKNASVIEAGDLHGSWSTAAGSITDDTRFRNLLAEAIINKGGSPLKGDFAKAIADYYYQADDDVSRGFMEEYFLKTIYGEKMHIWGGQPVSAALMMNSPIGLIHPCDAMGAFRAAQEIDFLSEGYAQVAANIGAACVAAAMVPDTNIDNIITAALEAAEAHRIQGPLFKNWSYGGNVGQPVERHIEIAVEIAREKKDVYAIRETYYERLNYLPIMVDAAQAIAVSLGMIVAADGDPKIAILGAVNYGRDCDTYASVVGAIVGALYGSDAVPADWIEIVQHANPAPDIGYLAQGLADVAAKQILQTKSLLELAEQLLV
jgi:ADP-ribosylglycohydrolase